MLVLFSRRSRLHPGTRYIARGLNNLASPGNEIECEQVRLKTDPMNLVDCMGTINPLLDTIICCLPMFTTLRRTFVCDDRLASRVWLSNLIWLSKLIRYQGYFERSSSRSWINFFSMCSWFSPALKKIQPCGGAAMCGEEALCLSGGLWSLNLEEWEKPPSMSMLATLTRVLAGKEWVLATLLSCEYAFSHDLNENDFGLPCSIAILWDIASI